MQYTKRKDGRYQSKVYLPNGKYKYVYAGSVKELRQKISEAKVALGRGLDLTAEQDTFKDWADYYLRQRQRDHDRGNLSLSRLNITELRLQDLEPLHSMKISKLRTRDFQDIIDDMSDEGYSVSVLKDVKAVAVHTCQLAIDNRVMDYNAAAAVRIPAQKHKEPLRRALTREEQSWIEQSDHRAKPAAMIMMYAGLRRSELIPLLWTDIDLDAGTISINKTVSFESGETVIKPFGKTAAAMRTVYIPQKLASYLREIKQGSANMLVCPTVEGKLHTDTSWRRMWSSFLHYLNFEFGDFSGQINYKKPKSRFAPKQIPTVIPNITPHWLRHTYITNLYFAGVDVLTAKELAGHADIKTTMSIYTHLDQTHKRKEIGKLDKYLETKNKTAVGQ